MSESAMKELLAAVGLAKARVDAGFSKVGRRLPGKADDADRALMLLAARSLSAGNAVMILASQGQPNESLPLLRAIAEWALCMRWIAAADSTTRAKSALAELKASGWGGLWDDARAKERAAGFGVPAAAIDAALGSADDFCRGNAQGLPWGHVVGDGAPGRGADAVLSAAAVWLALALEALDRRWPGEFPGAAEMRDRASISRGQ